MINGLDYLKKMYPNATEEELQPCGLDLRLGQIYEIDSSEDYYGLFDEYKKIPEHIPKKCAKMDEKLGWLLEPGIAYIAEVNVPIRIKNDSTQLYLPRSSLIRAGVHVCSSVGDAGYSGRLSFMIINFSQKNFFIEKESRFAQLLDFQTAGVSSQYDGDYQENIEK